jgi:hypothetical protein
MKLHRLLGIVCALIALGASSARADQAAFAAKVKADADLLGYWSFEGNYEDQSGKGNHATAFGDTTLIKSCPGVKGGQGVEFDNTTAEGQFLAVKAPIGSVYDTPSQSVFVWGKVTSEPEDGHWDNLLDRSTLWYMDTQWQDRGDGTLGLDYVARIYDPAAPESAGSGQVRSSATKTFVGGGEWHMYGFTYDGKVMVTYIDDKEVARQEYEGGIGPTADTPADPPKGQYDLNWGSFTQKDTFMNGCVDDTVIFGRALSAEEVKALYDAMMKEPAPAP